MGLGLFVFRGLLEVRAGNPSPHIHTHTHACAHTHTHTHTTSGLGTVLYRLFLYDRDLHQGRVNLAPMKNV